MQTQPPNDLGPEAWALLGFICRHTRGGAPAPPVSTFAEAYATLISQHLIERSDYREIWVISDNGERLLREHYGNS